jgi:poly(A) polymerase
VFSAPDPGGRGDRGSSAKVENVEQQSVVQGPNAQRAMDALDWAVVQAERGGEIVASDAVKAAPGDFRAAATTYMDALRIRLDRIVMSSDAEAGLDALLVTGALVAILPEVEAMVGFGDGEWRHKDVWKHTKQVVRQAVPRLEVRWAALLHDIGKVKTRSISPSGEVHFFGHAEVGARMFDKIDRRVPLFTKEPAFKSSVRFLILHHLRASQYEASWTDSAVRRFTKEMGGCLDDVLNLSRADITTKRPEKKRKGLKQISDLAERVRVIAEMDAVVPPLPSGIGDDMMKAFGIPPSRRIGELKKALEAAVDAGEVASHQDSAFYLAFLRDNAERFGLA